MEETKRVYCCRCGCVILESEKMITLPPGSNQVVAMGSELGVKTEDVERFRHGDTALCIGRLLEEIRNLRLRIHGARSTLEGEDDYRLGIR